MNMEDEHGCHGCHGSHHIPPIPPIPPAGGVDSGNVRFALPDAGEAIEIPGAKYVSSCA
jgi:hypothetical protein